ncbi:MAG: tetratricopeptide repeat protein [Myxococcales bacterium]|nr:tetratricopeptide repeat protein [Myxococcales bacterium]
MRAWTLAMTMGLLCILLFAGSAGAASMKAANDSYARGDWEEAIESYEALTETGILHEDLYYNLGNAHFRAGHYGLAIFGYEQALRIAPEHGDAAFNLRLARDVVSARSTNQLRDAEGLPWWIRYSLYMSISESTFLLLLANVMLFSALLLRQYQSRGLARTTVSIVSGFLGLAVLLSALVLAGHIHANENIHHGVTTGDLVIMREGPDSSLEERGQLHPGLRITVLSREPDWLLVRIGNGAQGWVPRSEVGLFR